jgi:hypothetical protein
VLRALGKVSEFRFGDGARHSFAERTHPGYETHAAKQSLDEAKRLLATRLTGRG